MCVWILTIALRGNCDMGIPTKMVQNTKSVHKPENKISANSPPSKQWLSEVIAVKVRAQEIWIGFLTWFVIG